MPSGLCAPTRPLQEDHAGPASQERTLPAPGPALSGPPRGTAGQDRAAQPGGPSPWTEGSPGAAEPCGLWQQTLDATRTRPRGEFSGPDSVGCALTGDERVKQEAHVLLSQAPSGASCPPPCPGLDMDPVPQGSASPTPIPTRQTCVPFTHQTATCI